MQPHSAIDHSVGNIKTPSGTSFLPYSLGQLSSSTQSFKEYVSTAFGRKGHSSPVSLPLSSIPQLLCTLREHFSSFYVKDEDIIKIKSLSLSFPTLEITLEEFYSLLRNVESWISKRYTTTANSDKILLTNSVLSSFCSPHKTQHPFSMGVNGSNFNSAAKTANPDLSLHDSMDEMFQTPKLDKRDLSTLLEPSKISKASFIIFINSIHKELPNKLKDEKNALVEKLIQKATLEKLTFLQRIDRLEEKYSENIKGQESVIMNLKKSNELILDELKTSKEIQDTQLLLSKKLEETLNSLENHKTIVSNEITAVKNELEKSNVINHKKNNPSNQMEFSIENQGLQYIDTLKELIERLQFQQFPSTTSKESPMLSKDETCYKAATSVLNDIPASQNHICSNDESLHIASENLLLSATETIASNEILEGYMSDSSSFDNEDNITEVICMNSPICLDDLNPELGAKADNPFIESKRAINFSNVIHFGTAPRIRNNEEIVKEQLNTDAHIDKIVQKSTLQQLQNFKEETPKYRFQPDHNASVDLNTKEHVGAEFDPSPSPSPLILSPSIPPQSIDLPSTSSPLTIPHGEFSSIVSPAQPTTEPEDNPLSTNKSHTEDEVDKETPDQPESNPLFNTTVTPNQKGTQSTESEHPSENQEKSIFFTDEFSNVGIATVDDYKAFFEKLSHWEEKNRDSNEKILSSIREKYLSSKPNSLYSVDTIVTPVASKEYLILHNNDTHSPDTPGNLDSKDTNTNFPSSDSIMLNSEKSFFEKLSLVDKSVKSLFSKTSNLNLLTSTDTPLAYIDTQTKIISTTIDSESDSKHAANATIHASIDLMEIRRKTIPFYLVISIFWFVTLVVCTILVESYKEYYLELNSFPLPPS